MQISSNPASLMFIGNGKLRATHSERSHKIILINKEFETLGLR